MKEGKTNESMYIGSNRRVGSNIIKLALKDSAEVTALARDLNRIEIHHERLRVIEGMY